jgi:hypothetical protein
VFKGWSEEKIYFAPTYKYTFNSDSYSGETATSKKKRRTPAWYLSSSFCNLSKDVLQSLLSMDLSAR